MRFRFDHNLSSRVAVVSAFLLFFAPATLKAAAEQRGGERTPGGMEAQKNQKGSTGEASVQLSAEQIREVQRKLNQKGYDAGHVDGNWNDQTRTAIRNFQHDNKFQVTGRLDPQTLDKLGTDFGKDPGFMERLRQFGKSL